MKIRMTALTMVKYNLKIIKGSTKHQIMITKISCETLERDIRNYKGR